MAGLRLLRGADEADALAATLGFEGQDLLEWIERETELIKSERHSRVGLVDAGKFDPAFEQFANDNELKLSTIFVTHNHGDHIAGVQECAQHFGARIIAGTETLEGLQVDRVLKHGDTLTIGTHSGRIV